MTSPTVAPVTRRKVDYSIGVLGKAMDLLDVLAAHEALSLTEVGRRAGVNKVTAFRILANFEQRGYVEREPATGYYRLGFGLMALGTRVAERLDLRTIARPVLRDLQQALGETVSLAVPGARGVVYVDTLQCAHGLRVAAAVGAQDDYHSTALGKAMAAFWPQALLEQRLGRRLEAKTTRTITRVPAFRRDLAATRQRGYAVDDGENEVGARGVGAPIFDHRGDVVAAVGVCGPDSRITVERASDFGDRVLAASRTISARLGYDPGGADPATPAGQA
jgi:IclR family acetate operon transcriptional repressor